jgi:hypothetical protein
MHTQKWKSLQERALKIGQYLLIGRHQLMTMISTGDFSEAKVFRRVDAHGMLTMLIERLVRIPRKMPTGRINSKREFDLLHVYRKQIERLVRSLCVQIDGHTELTFW